MDRICTSSGFCESDRIKRHELISFRSGFGFDVKRSRRRRLTGSQSIVFIICDDIGQIDISSARMKKMTESDSVAITISSIRDDRQIRIGEFDSGSKRKWSSMQNFASITIDILAHLTSTTDTRKDDHFVFWYIEFLECVFDSRHNKEISTSWTSLDLG